MLRISSNDHCYNVFFLVFFWFSICGSPWHNVPESWIFEEIDKSLVFANHVHDYAVVCHQCNYLLDKVHEKGYWKYMDDSDENWYDQLGKEAQELFNTDLSYSIKDMEEMGELGRQCDYANALADEAYWKKKLGY